jgi:acyl carrier protein
VYATAKKHKAGESPGARAPSTPTQAGGHMSVEERVQKIIMDQLGVSAEEIRPDASFVEDLGADSLDLTELIMAMEEEFSLVIDDEEAQKLLKVKDAVAHVERHLKSE